MPMRVVEVEVEREAGRARDAPAGPGAQRLRTRGQYQT